MNRGRARGTGGYRGSRGRSLASGNQCDCRKSKSRVEVSRPLDESSGCRGRGSRGRGRSTWSIRDSSSDASEEIQMWVPKNSLPVDKGGILQIGVQQERKSQEGEVGIRTARSNKVFALQSEDHRDPLPSPAWSSSKNRNPKGDPILSGGWKVKDMNDGTRLPNDLSMRMEALLLSSQEESPVPSKCSQKDEPFSEKDSSSICDSGGLWHSSNGDNIELFDIFLQKTGSMVVLKPSLLALNRERRNAIKQSTEEQNGIVLRSGMVLLKNYLSISDQVMVAKTCRQIGLGPGGFYQPGYRDGALLHLKMMCLGKNWDPETCQYGDSRPIDGAKPPQIPPEFNQLVEKAIEEAQFLVARNAMHANGEDKLPFMLPDICLVNFYSATGRLGLHQDKDESEESLRKGLPVVSFSIGDSAEFLYGDQRDADRAEKVILESGDILLFGGASRKVFHGVKSIRPNTAPKALLQETNLRPGRLNLTFRQY